MALAQLSYASHADRIATLAPADVHSRSTTGVWVARELAASLASNKTAASPWDPLHKWAARVDASSSKAIADGLREVAAGMTPQRAAQLLAAASRKGPKAGDRFDVCSWCLDLQNATRARVGRTDAQREPIPYATAASRHGWPRFPSSALHMHQSAYGVGDAIVGLYAACGLADATGGPVAYHTRFTDWLDRAAHPNVFVTSYETTGPDVNAGWTGYQEQLRSSPSRVAAYCANAAVGLKVPVAPPASPARIDRSIRSRGNPAAPYAILAPFSHFAAREWPREQWRELARLLIAIGVTPYAIDSKDELRQKQLRDTFGDIPGAKWLAGRDARSVGDLLFGAEVVVGNDSGIVHVGGFLGVPTVVVHGGAMSHEFLFGQYGPAVTSVTSGAGVLRGHDANHGALSKVTAAAVMAEVERRLGAWPRVTLAPDLSGVDAIA